MYNYLSGKKMSQNPLSQYFRKPIMHIELPSSAKYYAKGVLTLAESGDIPIYPMTALDEITYKTPDALFNGSAVANVIRSCIPAISDPWQIPTIDLNLLLTAIRIASIGSDMEIESTCPKCEDVADYNIDLRILLDNPPDTSLYDEPILIGDLEVFFHPLTYKQVNENNKHQFNDAQLQRALADDNVPEDTKLTLLSSAFEKIAELTFDSMTKSLKYIKTPDEIVDDKKFIREFLTNIDGDAFNTLKARLIELKKLEDLDDLPIQCSNEKCLHEYKQPFTLDMTHFFERNS